MKVLVERQELTVYTVGHSTRSIEEFVEILKAYNITLLVDVRTVPRSRHNPQFNKEALPNALKPYSIRYLSMTEIGGFRHPKKDSINMAWENSSFRGYADYMQTKEFTENLLKLVVLAKRKLFGDYVCGGFALALSPKPNQRRLSCAAREGFAHNQQRQHTFA